MGDVPPALDARRRRPPRRGVSERIARFAAGLATAALTFALIAFGLAYLRLSEGPIVLDSYAPAIETRANEMMAGGRLAIGGAELTFAPTGGAEIRVRDVEMFDETGATFARAPMASASFGLLDLAMGRIAPRDVALSGVSARLIREPDGRFSFGFGGADNQEAGVGEGAGLFQKILDASGEGDGGGGGRQRLVFRDASFLYLDRLSGRTWRTDKVGIRFWRSAHGLSAEAEGVVRGGRFGDMALDVEGYRSLDGDIIMSASVKNAAPRDIADQIRALDWLAAFDAPVDANMALSLNPAGDLLGLSGRMDVGEGALTLDEGVTEPVTSASLEFELEPESERFLITEATLESDRATATGGGFVQVGRDEAGEVADVVAQLDLRDIRLSAPEALRQDLAYDAARATGRITLAPFGIEIGELRLEQGPLHMTAAGLIEVVEGDIRADVTLHGGDMTVEDLLRHWPTVAAPGAYDWMAANMIGADITDFDASIRLGGDEDDVKFDFSFINGAGHYLRPMPPITDAVGAGQVDLKRFSLAVDAGRVTPEGGAPLDIAGSTFVIADLDHPATPAAIELQTTGALADALAIIDHEPLGFISKLGLPLDNPGGRVAVTTKVTLPLLKALLLEDVEAAATATIEDLSISAAELGGEVTARKAELEADTTQFRLSANAAFNGLPLSVRWSEVFAGGRDIRLSGAIKPDTLKTFGVAAPWFSDGSVAVVAEVGFAKEGPRIDVTANLENGAFRVGEIGWTKPAGEAAQLSARIVLTDDAIRAPNYALESRDLRLSGNARLSPGGALERFKLDRLEYRGGADIAVTGRDTGERWNIGVEGRLLDITKFEDLLEGGDTGRDTPLRLKLDLDRLQLRPGLHLAKADGLFFVEADGGVRGRVEALVEGAAPFRLRVESGPAGGKLAVVSANAGELMRAMGVFDDGAGGELRINANIAETEDIRLTGTARIKDIVIHEDAKLEALLLGADLDDLRAKMRSDGIVFDRISAPFTFADETLSAKEAVAVAHAGG